MKDYNRQLQSDLSVQIAKSDNLEKQIEIEKKRNVNPFEKLDKSNKIKILDIELTKTKNSLELFEHQ